MSGVNRVILVGNLGKDPETRTLDNGTKVSTFSLATTEKYKDQQGQMKEVTEWHTIVLWKHLAELAEKYLVKGSKIYLEGKITSRSWDDKEGKKHYRTEIVGNSMTFLGGNKGTDTASKEPANDNQNDSGDMLPF